MRLFERSATALAYALAVIGGVVLTALVVMTVVSILGRMMLTLGFGGGPVPGDFELIEAGTALAIFCFLPWCQLNRGHASVEVLANAMPDRLNRFIDLIVNLAMLAAAVLIGWRHWLGTLDKFRNGETTFILQMPVAWAYAAVLPGIAVWILVALYCVLRSGVELRENRHIELAGSLH